MGYYGFPKKEYFLTPKDILKNYNPLGFRVTCTYKCNKNCKFCYQKVRYSVDLNPLKLNSIFTEFKELGFYPSYITFQGGEMTILEHSLDLMNIAYNIFHKTFNRSVTTNGLMSTDYYKSLHMYGISHITFSVNTTEELHSLYTKILIIKNSGYYTVRINCCVDEENYENIKEIYEFCKLFNISLTFCEDMNSNIDFKNSKISQKAISDIKNYQIIDHENQVIYKNFKDNFQFWVFKHHNNYGNQEIHILPNGELTMNFQDVINGNGS
jgi:MoaA/NifB/PqqE/SkfB family radical SAM enzyme